MLVITQTPIYWGFSPNLNIYFSEWVQLLSASKLICPMPAFTIPANPINFNFAKNSYDEKIDSFFSVSERFPLFIGTRKSE
jgi:hypothetical protein